MLQAFIDRGLLLPPGSVDIIGGLADDPRSFIAPLQWTDGEVPLTSDTKQLFAARIEGLVQSEIRRMSRECAERDGINLGQGICDQPVEEVIKAATSAAVNADLSTYSPFEGIAELRSRIAGKMQAFNEPWLVV